MCPVPSSAFFAMRVSHVISDSAFRAFVMIERACDSDGETKEMSAAHANVEFCGFDNFSTTEIAPPIKELASVGLVSISRTPGCVRLSVDPSLLYNPWSEG